MISKIYLSYLLKFLNKIDRLVAHALCYIIVKLRPLLGPENVCPFSIGCTNFAIFNLENQPIPLAFWAILKRLLRCNPISIWVMRIKQKSC